MERISLSLPSPQLEWLRAEAQRIGITIGELLRRIVDAAKEPRPK